MRKYCSSIHKSGRTCKKEFGFITAWTRQRRRRYCVIHELCPHLRIASGLNAKFVHFHLEIFWILTSFQLFITLIWSQTFETLLVSWLLSTGNIFDISVSKVERSLLKLPMCFEHHISVHIIFYKKCYEKLFNNYHTITWTNCYLQIAKLTQAEE